MFFPFLVFTKVYSEQNNHMILLLNIVISFKILPRVKFIAWAMTEFGTKKQLSWHIEVLAQDNTRKSSWY